MVFCNIDDKQFLDNFVATYKEQDLADYMALFDLPPEDFGDEIPDDLVPKFKERDL